MEMDCGAVGHASRLYRLRAWCQGVWDGLRDAWSMVRTTKLLEEATDPKLGGFTDDELSKYLKTTFASVQQPGKFDAGTPMVVPTLEPSSADKALAKELGKASLHVGQGLTLGHSMAELEVTMKAASQAFQKFGVTAEEALAGLGPALDAALGTMEVPHAPVSYGWSIEEEDDDGDDQPPTVVAELALTAPVPAAHRAMRVVKRNE